MSITIERTAENPCTTTTPVCVPRSAESRIDELSELEELLELLLVEHEREDERGLRVEPHNYLPMRDLQGLDRWDRRMILVGWNGIRPEPDICRCRRSWASRPFTAEEELLWGIGRRLHERHYERWLACRKRVIRKFKAEERKRRKAAQTAAPPV